MYMLDANYVQLVIMWGGELRLTTFGTGCDVLYETAVKVECDLRECTKHWFESRINDTWNI